MPTLQHLISKEKLDEFAHRLFGEVYFGKNNVPCTVSGKLCAMTWKEDVYEFWLTDCWVFFPQHFRQMMWCPKISPGYLVYNVFLSMHLVLLDTVWWGVQTPLSAVFEPLDQFRVLCSGMRVLYDHWQSLPHMYQMQWWRWRWWWWWWWWWWWCCVLGSHTFFIMPSACCHQTDNPENQKLGLDNGFLTTYIVP